MGEMADYYRDHEDDIREANGDVVITLYDPRKYTLHTCESGKIVCINSTHPMYDVMTNDHLINTIRYLERKAKAGISIGQDPVPVDVDLYSPPIMIYGEEALKKMKYGVYIEEAKKRKLL